MHAILYVSDAVEDFGPEELSRLATHARERNGELGVTGYLYFESGRFFQYIEGEAAVVEALMERIDEDDRHLVLGRLQQEVRDGRRFPKWSMGLVQSAGVPRVEEVLGSHLRFMMTVDDRSEANVQSAWHLVDEIAELQELAPALFA